MKDLTFERTERAHPLAGAESWPASGPIYGFMDDQKSARTTAASWLLSTNDAKFRAGSELNTSSYSPVWY